MNLGRLAVCLLAILLAAGCRADRQSGHAADSADSEKPGASTAEGRTARVPQMEIEGCCRLRPPADAQVTHPRTIDVQAVVARGTDYEITMSFEQQSGADNPLGKVPVRTIKVGGKDTAIWTAEDARDPSWQTRSLSIQVRPPTRDGLDILPGDHVTLFARCRGSRACELAEQAFQTLDLTGLQESRSRPEGVGAQRP